MNIHQLRINGDCGECSCGKWSVTHAGAGAGVNTFALIRASHRAHLSRVLKMGSAPERDPLVVAVRKVRRQADAARRKTVAYQVEVLVAQRQKWQRKATRAINKLAEIDRGIRELAMELATRLDGETDKAKGKQ